MGEVDNCSKKKQTGKNFNSNMNKNNNNKKYDPIWSSKKIF